MVDNPAFSHMVCGAMFVVSASLHVFGHLHGFIPAVLGVVPDYILMGDLEFADYLLFKEQLRANTFTTALEAKTTLPAITGYILIFILCMFWLLSTERVRKSNFELFQYAHGPLVIAWTITLVAHGWKQWLGVGAPLALIVVVPMVLNYVLDRWMYVCQVKITDATIKKRTVMLELDVCNSGMQYSSGMYCMLNVPELSQFEWHPFTIASSGGRQKFHVLFANAGDWTCALRDRLIEAHRNGNPYPAISARGGYGSPATGMPNHKHMIMIGGGVGAAPFLAFLSSICETDGPNSEFDKVESAVFYWVTREPEDFAWINKYADKVALNKRVRIHLCLTSALEASATRECSASEIALFWMGVQTAVTYSKEANEELCSEIGAPTKFGRPNWQQEFADHVEDLLQRERQLSGRRVRLDPLEVSVFLCGGAALTEPLEDACSLVTDDRVRLRLYAEGF
jgi:predicted ferric reductase